MILSNFITRSCHGPSNVMLVKCCQDLLMIFQDLVMIFQDLNCHDLVKISTLSCYGHSTMFKLMLLGSQYLAMIFKDLAIIFKDLAMIFQDLAMIFQDLAMIFQDLAMIFQDLAMIFQDLAMILSRFQQDPAMIILPCSN